MDMSFANQALSAEYIVTQRASGWSRRSTPCRDDIDHEIARAQARRAWASRSTRSRAEQARYLATWDEGT